ncbi:hypothetical protein OEA41_002059 [Lepraria neglecta]|uniref:Uncharacterized protein n=1 Tax=Lepraria neglecta TaxID=209136 RepID=A0AAE0DPK7_9LECA|nr:hypothetical protein OEA41_002059 [Lepraria neglecta]
MAKPAAKTPHGVNGSLPALNDWPNDIGFDVFQDETTPIELKVTGKIPAYAA